jgi:hypothetical protein
MRTEDHQKHATVFPSLNPSGRQEVLALKQALDAMLEKAGVPVGGEGNAATSLDGPTQLHNLLELIRTEQKIYNIVFHEVIRQVSISCVERGELLSELRTKYSGLLSKVPEQIKGLHEELLAQRAFGRRLASELMQFKDNVSELARELSTVKERDFAVMEQVKEDKELLQKALQASEKNSSALQEYRDIYEMHRRRFLSKISELKCERDIWEQAAYKLANRIQVGEGQKLQDIRRLQICEQSWYSLVQHFSLLLSDRDLQQLVVVQEHAQSWKEASVQVVTDQLGIDRQLNSEMSSVGDSMSEWARRMENCKGSLESSEIDKLMKDIEHWDQVLSKQYSHFAGEEVLRRQEQVQVLSHLVESWADQALAIFRRHCPLEAAIKPADSKVGVVVPPTGGSSKEEQSSSDLLLANSASLPKTELVQSSSPTGCSKEDEARAMMTELNRSITAFLLDLGNQVTGENGVASVLLRVGTPVEAWSQKFKLISRSQDKRIAFSDQKKFHSDLGTWISSISSLLDAVKPADRMEDTKLGELLAEIGSWIKAMTHFVNGKNSLISIEAEQVHTSLTHWMVDCLLYMTRKPGDESFELLFGNGGKMTQAELVHQRMCLCEQFSGCTARITRCCSDVVYERAARLRQDGAPEDVAESEVKELKKIEAECGEWIKMANFMLSGAVEEVTAIHKTSSTAEDVTNVLPKHPRGERDGAGPEDEWVYVVGEDSNIHCRSLSSLQQMISGRVESAPADSDHGLPTVKDIPTIPAEVMPTPEELIVEISKMEETIKLKEEAVESAELRARQAEDQLKETLMKIGRLEAALHIAEHDLNKGQQRKQTRQRRSNTASPVNVLSSGKS